MNENEVEKKIMERDLVTAGYARLTEIYFDLNTDDLNALMSYAEYLGNKKAVVKK